jgi:uncharacterized protein YndB with AHSA1/START domain
MTASENVKIERSVWIKAARSRVWRALTNLDEFSKWFGVEAVGEFAAGQRLQMTSTHPGYEGVKFFVTVETIQPEECFAWRWIPGSDAAGDPNPATTLVELRLRDSEGGTLVTVTESGFDRVSLARRAKVLAQNEEGWKIQMASLERYAAEKA